MNMSDLSNDDEDEQLKLAIALSLRPDTALSPPDNSDILPQAIIDLTEHGEASIPVSKSNSSTNLGNEDAPSSTASLGFRRLDRKAMEAERLARKRKATISPPPLRSKAAKTAKALSDDSMNLRDASTDTRFLSTTHPKSDRSDRHTPSALPYPAGVVKKTWCLGFPREDDIKLEEVLEPKDLKLAVLSSFQWDVEWLLRKIDMSNTKIVMVMQAKDESTKVQYRQETASMPNLRLCFPSMQGQVNCMHSKLMLLAHPTYLRVVVPTANLVPYDWGENGVIENSVFLIDLPRHPMGTKTKCDEAAIFCKELIYFCEAMGLQQESINSLYDFDFSATKDLAFVHTIGGAHVGEAWRRTGYCGLGNAIKNLGLATEQPLEMDFVTSSVGALNIDFLTMLYLAAQGDSGLKEYEWRTTKSARKAPGRDKEDLIREIEENFRLYFPSRDTVLSSRGGVNCAGPICFSSKWYNASSFPQKVMRDCKSTRQGLLMHNKIIYARPQGNPTMPQADQGIAWAYIGSANCSESAWGKLVQDRVTKKAKLNCRNWECGVIVSVRWPGSREVPTRNLSSEESLTILEKKIPIPVLYPGERYEGRQPWFNSSES